MTEFLASIFLKGNKPELTSVLTASLENSNLRVESTDVDKADYIVLLYEILDTKSETLNGLVDLINDNLKTEKKICLVISCTTPQSPFLKSELEKVLHPFLSDRKINLRVIITFDLYQIDGTFPISPFENNLSEINRLGQYSPSQKASFYYYPTAIDDLSDLILKSLFISNTSSQVYVGVSEEITDLELGYLLKKTIEKNGRTLDINLSTSQKTESKSLFNQGIETQALLNWIPKINFSDHVSHLLNYHQEEITTEIPEKPRLEKLNQEKINKKPALMAKVEKIFQKHDLEKKETSIDLHKKEEKGIRKIIFISIFTVVLLILLPIVITYGGLYLCTKETYNTLQEIRNGKSEQARVSLNRAQMAQKVSSSSFQSLIGIGNLFAKSTLASTNNYLLVLDHSHNLLSSVLDTYELGDQLYKGLLGKQNIDVKTLSSALRVNLVTVSEKLSQIQLSVGQINLPFGYQEKINTPDINRQINLLKSQIALALPLLDLVDVVGSNQGIQRYLIVIQDTNEIRPTGGFISSYGLITFDQGKIIDFQIDSSLTLDRLIEGKIDPPNIVKQLLGQTNWNFHDSNLDADFSLSAKQMAWFYQRFKTATLDGVVGLNLNFLKNLLEQIGSVNLVDGQSVDKDNLVTLASNPTASKGLDVTTALTQTLAKKLLASDISFAHLSRALLKTVAFNEFNIWFSDNKLETLAESSGLSGKISSQSCHPQLASLNCHADTIHLNESNMSVNKLNFYLRKNQNVLINIENNGNVNYTLDYDYFYPVPAPTTITGNYKAYYQFYLPLSASGLTINLDNQIIDPNAIVQTNQNTLTKIEFSASLTINQKHRLEIKFSSPHQLDIKKQLIPFTLAIIKQPGTQSDSLTVKVHYPSILQAKSMTIPLNQTSAQELVFQTNQISQENLGIIFKNQSL